MVPIYYRLADDIKCQIESGQLKHGDMIPTEGQLGETYNISRMTVRQGLALLAEARLIETVKGKGSFVTRPRLSQVVINLQDNAAGNGEPLRYRLLTVKFTRDNNIFAKELGLKAEAKVIQLKRLLYQGEHVIAIEDKWMPYLKGKPLLETQLEYADFPEVVAKHQESVPVRNSVVISVNTLSTEQAELLGEEPGSPALVIKQIIYSKDDKPLGISHMVCHKDRFQIRGNSYPYSGGL
jgi:GntR family transcriptional regulator